MPHNITKIEHSKGGGIINIRKEFDCSTKPISVSYTDDVHSALDTLAGMIEYKITYTSALFELISVQIFIMTSKGVQREQPLSQHELDYLVDKVYSEWGREGLKVYYHKI